MTLFSKDAMVACIKAELDRQGLTQAEFAKMIGRTEKHVSQVMTGKAGTVELDYWAFVLGKKFVIRMIPLDATGDAQ